MMLKWFLIFTLANITGYILASCTFEKKEFYGQFVTKINVKKPSNVQFTWEWIKGNSNITIFHTNDMEISSNQSPGNFELIVKDLANPSGAVKNNPIWFGVVLSITITILLFRVQNRNHCAAICLVILSIISFTSSAIQNYDCNVSQVILKVPIEYVDQICLNHQECFPTKCRLSLGSVYSTFPANNRILFSGKFCALKIPERWEDWVQYHFKTNESSDRFLLRDSDNDGLINLIEYYGDVNFFNQTNIGRKRRASPDIATIGSNPSDPDTDGDLLLDGFEFWNGMSTKRSDDKNADNDSDGLTNLQEQIRETDPRNRDTDGDGVDDGTEVTNGADPKDPSDQGQPLPDQSFAMVKLTIGDHSGSHSERYFISVGVFKHQSPDYGKVGSGVYKYLPGSYKITIHHIDSNLESPDYDYTALIQKQSGKASVQINDTEGILGVHDESRFDFTLGKSAIMIVEGESKPGTCSGYKTCHDCQENENCEWKKDHKSCTTSNVITKLFKGECACSKCLSWYNEEKKDTRWLKRLNEQFKCPCRAQLVNNEMKEIDNPSNVKWESDQSCTNPTSPGCAKYHPGSAGCLRSVDHTVDDAGQQCCYGKDGKLLPAGTRGAGTPDKQYGSIWNVYDHLKADVWPFDNCCLDCEIKSYCNYYINDVRKGDNSHCPK